MPPGPAQDADGETLRQTLQILRRAREFCRGANLDRLLEGLDILRTASAEFEAWTAQVRRDPCTAAGPLGPDLIRVKREVASLLRLVDGCAAVQRGLSARFGATAVAYSPKGSIPIPASVSSACDMQG